MSGVQVSRHALGACGGSVRGGVRLSELGYGNQWRRDAGSECRGSRGSGGGRRADVRVPGTYGYELVPVRGIPTVRRSAMRAVLLLGLGDRIRRVERSER